jgi:hypothetical protein
VSLAEQLGAAFNWPLDARRQAVVHLHEKFERGAAPHLPQWRAAQ